MHILLNWILQGTMVAAATAGGLRLLRRAPAAIRYRVCWAALLAILGLPLVPTLWTAVLAPVQAPASVLAHSSAVVLELPPQDAVADAALLQLPAMFSAASVLIGTAWLLWTMLQTVRVIRDVRWLRRARRRCHDLPPHVATRFSPETNRLIEETGARVVLCGVVRAAAVLGGGRPLIGLQARIVEGLTDGELNAVLVHELTHVVRRDMRATVVQRATHVLAGWHPGVWWTIRRLTLEREMACDETALAAAGGPKAYATCLTRIAGLVWTPARSPELAMGMLAASGLHRRVVHVLTPGRFSRRAAGLAGSTLCTSLCTLALALGTVAIFGEPAMADGVTVLETVTPGPVRMVRQPQASRGARHTSTNHVRPAFPGRAEAGARPTRPSTGTRAAATVTPLPRERQAGVPAAAQTAAQPDITIATGAESQVAGTAGTPVAAPPAEQAATTSAAAPAQLSTDMAPAPTGAPHAPPDRTITDVAVEAAVGTATGATEAWNATTDAAATTGVAVGRGTQRGAVKTAGAFARWGRRIASSF